MSKRYQNWTSIMIIAPCSQELRQLLRPYRRYRDKLLHFTNAMNIAIGSGVYEEVFDDVVAGVAGDATEYHYFAGYYTRLVEEIESNRGVRRDLDDIMADTDDEFIAEVRDAELHADWWMVSIEYRLYEVKDDEY